MEALSLTAAYESSPVRSGASMDSALDFAFRNHCLSRSPGCDEHDYSNELIEQRELP